MSAAGAPGALSAPPGPPPRHSAFDPVSLGLPASFRLTGYAKMKG